MTDTKTKADLVEENADLMEENEGLRVQSENTMTKCPNCGFDPAEHKRLVNESTPA